MAKITPILILIAIVASLWLSWAASVMIAIWCLFFLYWINFLGKIVGRRRWYKIPKGWNYSTVSLLDMFFFWNRITFRNRLTFKFYINSGMLEEDPDCRMNKLGGIWLDKKNSIRLGFRALDDENYVVNSYLHFKGDIISGKEIEFNIKKNKEFTMNFRRQEMRTIHGLQTTIRYWVVDEDGMNVFSGFFDHDGLFWGLMLPYWEDMTKRINVEVECI